MKKTIASETVSLSAKDIRPLSVALDRKALAEITGGVGAATGSGSSTVGAVTGSGSSNNGGRGSRNA